MAFNPIEHEQGEFNAGIAKLFRLNTIKEQIHGSRINKHWHIYYDLLISYYYELRPIANDKKREYYDERMRSSTQSIKNLMQTHSNKQWMLNADTLNLMQWESELHDLDQHLGLGMPKLMAIFLQHLIISHTI